MTRPIAIFDLFSGPGGLGEGFSAMRNRAGEPRYQIDTSIEKESSAHRTLRLRAFLRGLRVFPAEYYAWLAGETTEPDWQKLYPSEWEAAENEALCLELGTPEASPTIDDRIRAIRAEHGGRTLLIGGPPCQAYSLVGRARNLGKVGYETDLDHRNFLYDEYVKVLTALAPAVFVMENVKGILSATGKGTVIFTQVLADLRAAGGAESYELFALSASAPQLPGSQPRPQDFIVRAEQHGVPQARHRVIIVGLRRDVVDGLPEHLLPRLEQRDEHVALDMVIGAMPRMRSGLSKADDAPAWKTAIAQSLALVEKSLDGLPPLRKSAIREELRGVKREYEALATHGRTGFGGVALPDDCPADLAL
jgi:DNA (cytosine-5)-methyltransferase 1